LPKPEIGESVEVKTGNDQDPLDYLMSVVNDIEADPRLRVRAAVAAAQYKHVKRGDGGKKEETAEKAVKAGQGKFKAAPSPLKLVGR
jgi:phage terminase small subunit